MQSNNGKQRVLYLSNLCSVNEYKELFSKTNSLINLQAQKFNRLIAEGLVKNDVQVSVISGRPVNHKVHKQRYYKAKYEDVCGISYNYLPFFNIFYLRQLFLFLGSRKATRKWIKDNPNGIILCDVLNYSLIKGVSKLYTKTKVPLIGIITDLPEMLTTNTSSINKYSKQIERCTHYVLVAEKMVEKLNIDKKPYIVIEGLCDLDMRKEQIALESKKKIIMYTGLIHKKYGIELLVQGFIEAEIKDYKLHIYGAGDYEEKLIDITNSHTNVKFFGSISNDEIVKLQQSASLLVNPRPTEEEFVKYSFPSKNLEYMASGTAVLTTKLPSMPKEYYPYVYLIEQESINGIKTKLKEILANDNELIEMGIKAKEFVLNEKNNIVQSAKIIDLGKSNYDRK